MITAPLDVRYLVVATPLLVIGVFSAFRLYSVQRLNAAEEFRRLLLGVSMIITTAVTFSFWTHSTFSRLWIALSWVLALIFVLASRWTWRKAVGKARERGRLALRTLIVGANAEAGRVVTEMRQRGLGFIPLGYVCADAWGRPTTDIPMIGHVDDLQPLIAEYDADCIFVASSAIRPEHMAQVSKAARRTGIEVRVTANVQEVLSSRVAAHPLGGLMAFALKPVRLSGFQALAKRSFDLGVTVVSSLILLPVFGAVALAVKLTSRGPVFFRQQRVGYHGRPFEIMKFRTMVVDAEDRLEDLLHMNEATGPLFKMKNDPRVTGRRPVPAQAEPRRAAAALQRDQGRHEPGGAAPAVAARGDPVRGVDDGASRGAAGHHGTVAGQRSERAAVRGLRPSRPLLHRELVARLRPVHPREDDPDARDGARRPLNAL